MFLNFIYLLRHIKERSLFSFISLLFTIYISLKSFYLLFFMIIFLLLKKNIIIICIIFICLSFVILLHNWADFLSWLYLIALKHIILRFTGKRHIYFLTLLLLLIIKSVFMSLRFIKLLKINLKLYFLLFSRVLIINRKTLVLASPVEGLLILILLRLLY